MAIASRSLSGRRKEVRVSAHRRALGEVGLSASDCMLSSSELFASVATLRASSSMFHHPTPIFKEGEALFLDPGSYHLSYSLYMCDSALARHLAWGQSMEANDQAIFRLAHQRLEEVFAAGSQHGPVPAELLALHQDSHIAQDILLPLVVEAEEDIGTMNRRLIHIHGGFRLLIHGHSAHALKIETQQRGVSLSCRIQTCLFYSTLTHIILSARRARKSPSPDFTCQGSGPEWRPVLCVGAAVCVTEQPRLQVGAAASGTFLHVATGAPCPGSSCALLALCWPGPVLALCPDSVTQSCCFSASPLTSVLLAVGSGHRLPPGSAHLGFHGGEEEEEGVVEQLNRQNLADGGPR
ncbi:hypothetical protein INR49_004275 [Caranx melampygus]|nr:hypothetical protein INR49_004275 [Caranx melampygus]